MKFIIFDLPSCDVEAVVPAGARVVPVTARAAAGAHEALGAGLAAAGHHALRRGQRVGAHRQHLQQRARSFQRPRQRRAQLLTIQSSICKHYSHIYKHLAANFVILR